MPPDLPACSIAVIPGGVWRHLVEVFERSAVLFRGKATYNGQVACLREGGTTEYGASVATVRPVLAVSAGVIHSAMAAYYLLGVCLAMCFHHCRAELKGVLILAKPCITCRGWRLCRFGPTGISFQFLLLFIKEEGT